ncbi:hypothetical protein SLEP1_g48058 [Rubroshorea leprosula]|uniref:Uncharacterized protein n=1 Tax=Rubroshorea leprosula TaxID=152421 RepID=A0AAV5LVD7_9ROSI|nr:hypothetical protein SLEP1_g48058 [Rubroshorea leprosula]
MVKPTTLFLLVALLVFFVGKTSYLVTPSKKIKKVNRMDRSCGKSVRTI